MPHDNLRGYASIRVGGWLRISDMRIIDARGKLFVSCPVRFYSNQCLGCGALHSCADIFCPACGVRSLKEPIPTTLLRNHRFDIAHPVDFKGREMLEEAVLGAFEIEDALTSEPDYHHDRADYDVDWAGWPDSGPCLTFLRVRQFGD
jgi:DNA-binding cell septation regulator SpoVG